MTLIQARQLLSPNGMINDGWVRVSGENIEDWGEASVAHPDLVIDGILVPGFVDIHCHGGGGAGFGTDAGQVQQVLDTHLRFGTTTLFGTLMTNSIEVLEQQIQTLAEFVTSGQLAGIHLEGPWLSPRYAGAHPPHWLRDVDLVDITRLLTAGRGSVRLVTIAPEIPGALAAIPYLVNQGVKVAIGHTGADFTTTTAAITAGATGATHLFNAMPDLLHRNPGAALALWQDPGVWVELIADGVHVHPALLAQVINTKPDKAVLITDAMAGATQADGDYRLGESIVTVQGGTAHLAGTTTIAGSTITLDQAIRTTVASGVNLETALRAATANPADYLGLSQVGRIKADTQADLVCLNNDLQVTRVMCRGQWV